MPPESARRRAPVSLLAHPAGFFQARVVGFAAINTVVDDRSGADLPARPILPGGDALAETVRIIDLKLQEQFRHAIPAISDHRPHQVRPGT